MAATKINKSIGFEKELWDIIDINIAEANMKKPGTFTGRADYFEKIIRKLRPDMFEDPKEKIYRHLNESNRNLELIRQEAVNLPNLNIQDVRDSFAKRASVAIIHLNDAKGIIKTLKEY